MIKKILAYIPDKFVLSLILFLYGVILFGLYRIIFVFSYKSYWDRSEIPDIIGSILMGFRFDVVVLGWFFLPLFLIILLPFVKLHKIIWQKILFVVFVFLFTLFSFIGAADIGFFDNFGSRMNYWAIEYIEHPEMFFYSMFSYRSFWLLITIWLIVSSLFYFVLRLTLKKSGSWSNNIPLIRRAIIYILAISLLVFGIRGRLGMKGLDWGSAFFCENQFINQSALNPVYTLVHSIYEESKDGFGLTTQAKQRFDFHDIDTAYTTVNTMLGLKHQNKSGKYNISRKNVADSTIGFSPNIVIVILESWSADKIGALGAEYGVTPEFDRLAEEGILFTDFYANGIRTNRGIPAILCSFPTPPGRSIMKRYSTANPFGSIAQILNSSGYQSTFAHGGDIEFDNIKGFLKSVGYNDFHSKDDFDTSERLGRWGLPDHTFFDMMIDEIPELKRPFNLTLLTLSYHEPFLIPDDRFKKYDDSVDNADKLNCIYYDDWALGQFIEGMKKLPVFDSTIFLFTSDHCPGQSSNIPMNPNNFKIPLLIYAPGLPELKPDVISKTGSQVDIIPTILPFLNIETEFLSWGQNLLEKNIDDNGFAVLIHSNKIGLIEGSDFYIRWLDGRKMLFNLSDRPYLKNNIIEKHQDNAQKMEKKLTSYIQMANFLSKGAKK